MAIDTFHVTNKSDPLDNFDVDFKQLYTPSYFYNIISNYNFDSDELERYVRKRFSFFINANFIRLEKIDEQS